MPARAARRHAARRSHAGAGSSARGHVDPSRRGRTGSSAPALAIAGAFALAYALVAVVRGLPAWCHAMVALANIACFALHALDKSAAVAGRRRVRERTLLVLAVAGGWPGGVLAQQALRHKTSKPAFRAWFWLGAAANAAAFAAAVLRG